jgi:cholesterol oxidase
VADSPSPLSKDLAELQTRYDIVIVGSGYAGSAAAARLGQINLEKRLGLSIAVLERGREWLRGEFPEDEASLRGMLRRTRDGKTSNPLGLFDIYQFEEFDFIQACGLGGSSLIDNAVLATPDIRVFEQRGWPDLLRTDIELGRVDKVYQLVSKILGRNQRPRHILMERHNQLARAGGLLKATDTQFGAAQLELDFGITFEEDSNAQGRPRNICTHCGACMTGCNVGARNTAVETFLAQAVSAGVQVFTRTELRSFSRNRGGYSLNLALHDGKDVDWSAPAYKRELQCGLLIVAAGSLGSTEILLRSRANWKRLRSATENDARLAKLGLNNDALEQTSRGGPKLPPLVGRGVGRNGNAVFAVYKGQDRTAAVAFGTKPGPDQEAIGPAVTSILELADPVAPLRDGIQVFDLAIPAPLTGALKAAFEGVTPSGGLFSSLGRLFGGGSADPLNQSLILFTTGHDDQAGVMALTERGDPIVRWQRLTDQEHFKRLEVVGPAMAKNLNGTLVTKLGADQELGQRPLTFDLLGGCSMGNDRSIGAVNDMGAVYDGSEDESAQAVLPKLFVLGRAMIPTSIGTNPSFISACLAERAAAKIGKKIVDGEIKIAD